MTLGVEAVKLMPSPLILGLSSATSLTRSAGIEATKDGFRAPARRAYASAGARRRQIGGNQAGIPTLDDVHLRANSETNGLADRCLARNAAVGSAHGRARATPASGQNSGMATVETDAEGAIEVVTLDEEVLGEARIDINMIDVEGWEVEVLRGAGQTLARHKPLLYIEIMQAGFDEVEAHLLGAGYLCWKRFNHTPTFLFLPRERWGRRRHAFRRPVLVRRPNGCRFASNCRHSLYPALGPAPLLGWRLSLQKERKHEETRTND